MRGRSRSALAIALLLGAPHLCGAQDTARIAPVPTGREGWNTPRARALVDRARQRRMEPMADSALRNYRAHVKGWIYFFIDRESDPEPVLLRADQVALDLYWGQPDRVKQVVRGMRSEEQFPIRDFRYYLDRYTVIQNGFDDVIRVGEGRDVRDVIHPLAREGAGIYDYRLADSTTIRLPGEPDPIRVYEIQVRPRSFGVPAIVGSLWLERTRADLVRLAFTFTPAAYIDPRNERVEILLENALWDGAYWLPREQRLLVRREIPEIDLDVGTVIRAALRVEGYDLNVRLPPGFFGGREVVMAAGPDGLADYDFDAGLFDGLSEVGLEEPEPGTLDAVDVEAIAGRILRERFLRGVPRVRLFAPGASDILRYGRTEGLVTGLGAAFGVGRSQLYAYGGYAWGSGDPLARVGWRPAGPDPGRRLEAEAYLNRPQDVGLRAATSGLLSSLSSALLGRDYRDIVPVSGLEVAGRWGHDRTSRHRVYGIVEAYRSAVQARTHAPVDEERRFRPVTPSDERLRLALGWERRARRRVGPVTVATEHRVEAGAGLAIDLFGSNGTDPDGFFARYRGHLDARWTDRDRRGGVEARLTGGGSVGELATHQYWFIGGPNTLPGHAFHGAAGRVAGVADVTAWREVVPRLIRARAFGALGFTEGGLPRELRPGNPGPLQPGEPQLEPWTVHSGRIESSVGLGLGLVDGILRVDLAFPTDSWDGVLILSVDPDLWPML